MMRNSILMLKFTVSILIYNGEVNEILFKHILFAFKIVYIFNERKKVFKKFHTNRIVIFVFPVNIMNGIKKICPHSTRY